jgi:MSHA pilin protein MshD
MGPGARMRLRASAGLTLIELVVALALGAVMMVTMWNAWSLLARRSADPLVGRQSLAIAQSLMREIELQPLPGTATAAATPGRTGYASIASYNGLAMTGITDAEGAAVAGLQGYNAAVQVTALALAGVPAASGWWIQVSVTGPAGDAVTLAQWRSVR